MILRAPGLLGADTAETPRPTSLLLALVDRAEFEGVTPQRLHTSSPGAIAHSARVRLFVK